MDVLVTLNHRGLSADRGDEHRQLRAGIKGSTLGSLLTTLSKVHPDLAPLLEDATNQADLEIYVNDRPVRDEGATFPLREGDIVSLFVKEP